MAITRTDVEVYNEGTYQVMRVRLYINDEIRKKQTSARENITCSIIPIQPTQCKWYCIYEGLHH